MLREKLAEAKPSFKVVTMPDFFLDYLLLYPGRLEEMTSLLESTANRGGGNIMGWKHSVGRGGNSSNLAAQLCKLGAQTIPIVETDELGKAILRGSLKGADLSHVKSSGVLSSTLSLEAEHLGRRVNMMVSDPGSHSNFGPERLTEKDREAIRGADYVAVVNWGQNLKGTDLAEEVFKTAREGKAVTFFDPGDPTNRPKDLEELNRRVLTSGLLDVLSVNESELTQLAAGVKDAAAVGDNPLFEAASVFSMLAVRVDVHTPEFSATFIDGQRERVPCLKLQPAKVTGAGDVWNAADIYGQGIGLDHSERLLFANATSAAYLRRQDLEPAGLEEILDVAEELEKIIEE